jgi:hypothetical protein
VNPMPVPDKAGSTPACRIEASSPFRTQPGASTVHEKPTDEQLGHRFIHHPPTGTAQSERYAQVRGAVLQCAKTIRDLTPCCPEQSRAFNALDEAMFLSNAAIARHE